MAVRQGVKLIKQLLQDGLIDLNLFTRIRTHHTAFDPISPRACPCNTNGLAR